ncbi:MAG: sigma factor-like helix-turn-helix DNA-binding protein [Candidatus Moraniibacteriota bacterium]
MKMMQKTIVSAGAGEQAGEAFFFDSLKSFSVLFIPRTKDIVWARFGLSGKKPKTLEAIGQEYGITRERVRQILASAFSSVRLQRDTEPFKMVSDRIESAIGDRGGIVSVPDLFIILADGSWKEAGALSFFLECIRSVKEMKETSTRERAFVVPSFSQEECDTTFAIAEKIVRATGRAMKEEEFYTLAVKEGITIDRKRFFDLLAVSARIRKNPFGYWGLADSDDISPRGTREKARLVLKMNGSPMHFKEIAAGIDEAGLQKRGRKTHAQTVHNELIKDRNFVLVGRGLYALSDWGYTRGTVRQVISDILRAKGNPMNREEIIAAVSKVRTVKRSTIVINLNAFFEKVGKDRYTVNVKEGK